VQTTPAGGRRVTFHSVAAIWNFKCGSLAKCLEGVTTGFRYHRPLFGPRVFGWGPGFLGPPHDTPKIPPTPGVPCPDGVMVPIAFGFVRRQRG
jgi:hypothetical protein